METNDSLQSCPPCKSPERCLGLNGQCGMVVDKERLLAAMRDTGAKIVRGMRSMTGEEQAAANDLFGNFTNPPHNQGGV